jgi:signal recognition particle subunit SRP14
VTHDGEDVVMTSDVDGDTREYSCLLRVTDGKQTKFSTKVSSDGGIRM